ncbi:uncharacterized protein LOC124363104 isoform X2 [Homalodisca vitripennis]|uniref:uncharacterized protein LOC124363104 isoform X2 n=1 Tax=Homalodisca vitripennis TaxID=197043 RepID=UPI001EEA9E1E|nr:uncharacterized protein LOC124363104 isoform X2 [Homalodisca vitripennis]
MCCSNICNVVVQRAFRVEIVLSIILQFLHFQYIFCSDFEHNVFLEPYLCENHTTSCAHQVASNDSDDACRITYYPRDSEACQSSEFKGDSDMEEEIGKLKITSYLITDTDDGLPIPAFNLSFTNIKWSRARIRFVRKSVTKNEVMTPLPEACRELEMPRQRSESASLYLDCLWSDRTYQGHIYQFQYIATPPDGPSRAFKYAFFVPNGLQRTLTVPMAEYQLFMVVDVSSLPLIRLRLQVAPPRYNITRYRVQLWRSSRQPDGNSWVVHSQILTTPPHTPPDTVLVVAYNSEYKPGVYNFTALPIHPHCTEHNPCTLSRAPEVLIVASPEMPLLIGIVGTVILIPVFLTAYFIWRRSCAQKPTGDEPRLPPKVLLIYNPNYPSHVDDMIEFHHYLKKSCHLDPLFDLFAIPNTDTKDPTRWYMKAFNEADFILVFASPPGPAGPQPHKLNTYLHLDRIALKQLQYRLALPRPRCPAVSVQLPGCSWETLPEEAKSLSRYALPRDQDPMLVFLGTAPMCDHGESLLAALNIPKQKPPSAFPLFNPCTTSTAGATTTTIAQVSDGSANTLAEVPRELSAHTISAEC